MPQHFSQVLSMSREHFALSERALLTLPRWASEPTFSLLPTMRRSTPFSSTIARISFEGMPSAWMTSPSTWVSASFFIADSITSAPAAFMNSR